MSRWQAGWAVAGVIVAALGFVAGRGMNSEDVVAPAFDLEASSYDAPASAAGLSKGGFSGFGESEGATGRTVVAGKVVAVTGDSLTIESPSGQRSMVRLTSSQTLRRLEPATREALRPGASVLIRRDGDSAQAVLVVTEAAR